MPPLDGPRAMLCVTRYPPKTRMEPSSICTGTDTSTHFFTPDSTEIRLGSMPNVSPTRRSCARASSSGFSFRCETDSVELIVRPARSRARVYTGRPSADPERHRSLLLDAGDRGGDETSRVRAGGELPPARAAAGE